VKEQGYDCFDADARAAELNAGSFLAIPASVRAVVNREFEAFINQHIASGISLTFETTLRSTITFEQALRARDVGFKLTMFYVALESIEMHLKRVRARVDSGGHGATEARLRQIHASSLLNLRRALVEFDRVDVYDNSGLAPDLVLVFERGEATFTSAQLPDWARQALPHSS
jgi:predicted ABC-type ATPase